MVVHGVEIVPTIFFKGPTCKILSQLDRFMWTFRHMFADYPVHDCAKLVR